MTMLKACSAWPGWSHTPLPANVAEVELLNGPPPKEPLSISQPPDLLYVLFCRSGGATLNWPDGQRLCLGPGRTLFLSGNAGTYSCRFTQVPFQGVMIQEPEQAALAALSFLWPDQKLSPPSPRHGCAVLEDMLWSESLFLTLDQLPLDRRGNYCVLKALELLYLAHAGGGPQPEWSRHLDRQQIELMERVHDYILEHLEQRLTIQQLSQQFGISGTSLKVSFRKFYGTPIHQYILDHRLAWATQLLCTTELSVLQISATVGYGSASQFGVAFKNKYHVSPSQFRAEAKMSFFDGFLSDTV